MPLRFTDDRRFAHECRSATGETFTATFRIFSDAEHAAFDLSSRDGEIDFLRQIVVDLDGLEDADGTPIPYDSGLREQVLGFIDLRVALLRGYRQGIVAAKSGN